MNQGSARGWRLGARGSEMRTEKRPEGMSPRAFCFIPAWCLTSAFEVQHSAFLYVVFLYFVELGPRPPVRSMVRTPPSTDQVWVCSPRSDLVVMTSFGPSHFAVAVA